MRALDAFMVACFAVLFAIVQGCGGDRAQTSGSAADHYASQFVFPDAAPEFLKQIPRFTVERAMRIDGYEADLVPIHWMVADRNGALAVIQLQDNIVRFFDASGKDLGRIGGKGAGPGEFERIGRAGLKGDSIWVMDTDLDRVTLISPEREFVRTLPPLASVRPTRADSARLPVFPFAFPHAVYPGDTLLILAIGAAGDPLAEALESSPFLRVSSDGVIQHFVLFIPNDDEASVRVTYGRGFGSVSVPFYPRPIYVVSHDGTRLATLTTALSGSEAGSFRVRLFDPMGVELFNRSFPFHGEPLPRHVVDSVVTAQAPRFEIPEMRRAYQTEARNRVPAIYPPVTALVIGLDGRIWLGLRAMDAGKPWLILSNQGEPVGIVVLPRNAIVHAADATNVWVTERDEVDVESIARFRISSPPRSPGSGRSL